MIPIFDLSEWHIVAEDFGYETIKGVHCWFAYDRLNHTIVGAYDDLMQRGLLVR
jgi:hypothetical protein